MTALLMKFGGSCLLICCGGGIGWLFARRKKNSSRQIECFVRFLLYLRESIYFRALPGAVVLVMATRHTDYSSFCPAGATTFSQIQPPEPLRSALGSELQAGFSALESSPRQTACDTLDHLAELCRQAGQQAQEAAVKAIHLYPRLGACLGLLTAILLA